MEQIVVRDLPAEAMSALRLRADRHRRSPETEAREILAEVLGQPSGVLGQPSGVVDLHGLEDGAALDFEPGDLGVSGQAADA